MFQNTSAELGSNSSNRFGRNYFILLLPAAVRMTGHRLPCHGVASWPVGDFPRQKTSHAPPRPSNPFQSHPIPSNPIPPSPPIPGGGKSSDENPSIGFCIVFEGGNNEKTKVVVTPNLNLDVIIIRF